MIDVFEFMENEERCDSHTFMVVMTRTVISNSTTDEYPMAVYDPEKDKEDREKIFF